MPELGDQPIQPEFEATMQHIARQLDKVFNGEDRGQERETGFILLVFNYGEKEGRANYISNGADRKDVVRFLKEQILRFEADDRRN